MENNKKLLKQFAEDSIKALKYHDRLDSYKVSIDSQASQKLKDEFIDSSNLSDRLGFYWGNINLKVEDKKGHLVVDYIDFNSKKNKYEYMWRVLSKKDRGKSLWEDIGQIEPTYIQGKSLDEMAKNINRNVKEEVKEAKETAIFRNKDFLIRNIELYQDVYFLDKDEEILNDITKKLGVSKEKILYSLETEFKSTLNNLKRLGADISEFPKSPSDTVK